MGGFMDRVFGVRSLYRAPDGTLASSLLNCKDLLSGLPFNLLDGFSLSAGTLEPRWSSRISLMPFVAQVTFVRWGRMMAKMKGPEDREPYQLIAGHDQAVLTVPGTFLQLINPGDEPCDVLFIHSPAFLFEISNGKPIYNDRVVVEEDWDTLAASQWRTIQPVPSFLERNQSERRLASRSA